MRVLLLNDNPVVNKLVTLSAQKRQDELFKIADKDAFESGSYDLLVVDEGSASAYLPEEIAEHVAYGYTLFIASRGTAVPDIYDKTLYKPFLPMELLGEFKKAEEIAGTGVAENTRKSIADEDASEEKELADEDEELPQNILNETEVQEVQGILDDFEDGMYDEAEEIGEIEDVADIKYDNAEEEEDILLEDDDVMSIEEQINKAIETLSQEDLMHEVDEEVLFDIAQEAKALEESDSIWDAAEDEESIDDLYADLISEAESRGGDSRRTKAADALETLLGMLSDEEVAASLKAMNISINISFGDKK